MCKSKSDEQRHDDNVQLAENLIIDLIYRVRTITGEITDWSDILASAGTGGFTVLNGMVIGKKGIACVESITAGGYNIQLLYIRALVHIVIKKPELNTLLYYMFHREKTFHRLSISDHKFSAIFLAYFFKTL